MRPSSGPPVTLPGLVMVASYCCQYFSPRWSAASRRVAKVGKPKGFCFADMTNTATTGSLCQSIDRNDHKK